MQKIFHYFFLTFFALFLAGYSIALYNANTDLTDGQHVIFMDEDVIFSGISQIYHSQTPKELFLNIIDGKDHRYGRIMWNIYAVTSYIPYLIYGETGQIIATRFTQDIILFSAYLILVLTFLKNFYIRSAAFAILLCLPSTAYYAHMTKPEPIQLLFLALFLKFALRDGLQKSKNWIFLGLSFGAKISLLPFVLCLFILNTLNFSFANQKTLALKNSGKNLLWFLLGLSLAASVILRGRVAIYIKSTFKTTGHGNDDASINFISWIEFIKDNYFAPLFYLILVMTIATISYAVYKFFKSDKSLQFFKDDKISLTLIAATSLSLPIIFTVHRLWGFYLHIATVFLFISFFIMIEENIVTVKNKIATQALTLFYSLFVFLILFNFSQKTFDEYKTLSQRTKNKKFIESKKERDFLLEFLPKISAHKNKKLKVIKDPLMFGIANNESYEIDYFGGPFRDWNQNYDVVILLKSTMDLNRIKENSAEYGDAQLAKKQYLQYVSNCHNDCYFEYKKHDLKNVRIFLHNKLN